MGAELIVGDCRDEVWLPVEGWEGLYEVSNLGRVRSLPREFVRHGRPVSTPCRVRVPVADRKGYPRLRLTHNSRGKNMRIHCLVARAFLGPKPDGYQINHKDGVKTNNNVENLEYVTASENCCHARDNGLRMTARGEQSGRSKLKEDDVVHIKRLIRCGVPLSNIGSMFGVSAYSISSIANGKNWSHVQELDRLENEVVASNCIWTMRDCSRKFALVLADPPFNQGMNYCNFSDRFSPKEYQQFTDRWIRGAWRLVDDGGVLVVHGSQAIQPNFWSAIVSIGLLGFYECQIVWHYRFGQHISSNWIDGNCHAIVLRKPGERRWYPDDVLVESDRLSKYQDPRVSSSSRSGMRVPLTVWGVPSDGPGWGRVTGNSKERWKSHPNQLPCRYVARIVKAYTRPGDWVLDPFTGSGTTGLVCRHEGRNFLGIDISPENAESARERIARGYYPPMEDVDSACG